MLLLKLVCLPALTASSVATRSLTLSRGLCVSQGAKAQDAEADTRPEGQGDRKVFPGGAVRGKDWVGWQEEEEVESGNLLES